MKWSLSGEPIWARTMSGIDKEAAGVKATVNGISIIADFWFVMRL